MKVLFIGGTGNISTSCTHDAIERGIELYHLNRGSAKARVPSEVQTILGDIRKPDEVRKLLDGMRFDAVVDWIAFTTDHVRVDLDLFRNNTDQFVFISSASVYHKPVRHHVITESTPAHNPYWPYSQNKIACERLLWDEYAQNGFPMTIVRPSHTYSDGWFPTSFGSSDYTYPQRMLDGKPVVVHGDGTSLWTITHTDDFAKGFNGLLGNPSAIGETFHITGDEQLTWNEIHRAIGRAVGAEPEIVHVPSEIIARFSEDIGAGLLGDKQHSVVFDNSKIKRYVPGYEATIPFWEGMRRSARWIEEHPEEKVIDDETNRLVDRLIAAMRAVKP
ncbi:MAG: SDR family oxidoreductase [Spirochaetota bacterium]